MTATNVSSTGSEQPQYVFLPKSVVVPLDGSTDSEAALPVASYLATAFGVEIRVVHAVDRASETPESDVSAFESYVAELASRGQLLREPRPEVQVGDAVEVILAASQPEDLLVMATHGRGGLRATVFGSIADRVLRGAHGPTVAVPVTHESWFPPIRNIVIAVEDSDCSAHATAVGRAFAERCGAAVTIAHSFLPTVIASGIEGTYAYESLAATEANEQAAEALVAGVAAPGEAHHALIGPAVEAIAQEAESAQADLVVSGASGHGFLGRLLLGSVSEGLMHRLDRLLLVVPRRDV